MIIEVKNKSQVCLRRLHSNDLAPPPENIFVMMHWLLNVQAFLDLL